MFIFRCFVNLLTTPPQIYLIPLWHAYSKYLKMLLFDVDLAAFEISLRPVMGIRMWFSLLMNDMGPVPPEDGNFRTTLR